MFVTERQRAHRLDSPRFPLRFPRRLLLFLLLLLAFVLLAGGPGAEAFKAKSSSVAAGGRVLLHPHQQQLLQVVPPLTSSFISAPVAFGGSASPLGLSCRVNTSAANGLLCGPLQFEGSLKAHGRQGNQRTGLMADKGGAASLAAAPNTRASSSISRAMASVSL